MAKGRRISLAIAAISTIGLAGCGGPSGVGSLFEKPAPAETLSAEQLFARGEAEVARGDADVGAQTFAELERLYPYSQLAKRAVIMQAFAFHKDRDYENARAAAQRYIEFYPADEDAAYAQYLIALSYYDQIDEIGRDQGLTFQALQALRAVIEGYPDTEYARSAVLKFDLAFDHLAAKEMEIGRYYLKRQYYAAAINRFRVVVEDFKTTTQTAEALHRLVESYLSLGLEAEAQTAGAILAYNFRGSEWYQESYRLLTGRGLKLEPAGDSWLSSIYRQLVKGEWL